MSNKETKARVARAFRAMKEIGIPEAMVKPVLKRLLKLYDKDWTLIEEENYRALADAIFEGEEAEANKQSKMTVDSEAAEPSKKTVNNEKELEEQSLAAEEPSRPLKRLRRRYQDEQSSSPTAATASGHSMPLIRPKDEPTELPDACPPEENASQSLVGSPQPNAEYTRTGPQVLNKNKGKQHISPDSLVSHEVCDTCQPKSVRSPSHAMKLRDRGNESACPQTSPGKTRSLPDSSPQAAPRKKWKIVQDTVPVPKQKRVANYPLIIPKDEPFTDEMPQIVAPIAVIDPVPSSGGDSSDMNGTVRELTRLEPIADEMPQIVAPMAVIDPVPSSGGDSSDRNGTVRELTRLEPIADEMPQIMAPIAVIDPVPSSGGDSSDRNGTVRELTRLEPSASPSMNEKERTDGTDTPNEARMCGELAMTSGHCASNLEIASSPSGEVKISLNCKLALARPDIHMPSLETILQMVEEKCLRSYKILDPGFSVMNIMKEICQCFLNLRSDQNSEGPANIDEHLTPTIDLSSKSSATDDLGAEGLHLSSLTGANDPQSKTELILPKTPLITPCNGMDDGCHLEERYNGDDPGTHKENEEIHAEETNGLSLVVADQLQVTPEMIIPLHDIFDVSKGQENIVITLVNEVNNESPPSFNYIPQNVVFQSAYVDFSLARIGDNNCSACSGNCLSSSAPCACAHLVRDEFAYTTDGLVKEEFLKDFISMTREPKKYNQFFCKECPVERAKSEDIFEPCKGHLLKKFIKECWLRCGCDKQCGNRVVQRGITRNLQVFMTSEGKGWGLRTLEDLPQGSFVCEFIGEVLTNSEFFDRILRSPKRVKPSFPVVLDAGWGVKEVMKDEEALCLDATHYGNAARFINHRCYDANLMEIPVEVETSDHHYYRLAFFTARKIKAMEELTWDYGIDFDDHDHPIKTFQCECGSKYCRNIRRSRTRASTSTI